MEELKINGQYKKEDVKRIMRLINQIKISGMWLAKVVEETDMPLIANIIAMRLLQYSAEKQIGRSEKEVRGLEDELFHALMLAERDNTLMTVEELWGTAEVEDAGFDKIAIQNKDGLILYYADRSAGIPEKFKNAHVDHMYFNDDGELVVTLAMEE